MLLCFGMPPAARAVEIPPPASMYAGGVRPARVAEMTPPPKGAPPAPPPTPGLRLKSPTGAPPWNDRQRRGPEVPKSGATGLSPEMMDYANGLIQVALKPQLDRQEERFLVQLKLQHQHNEKAVHNALKAIEEVRAGVLSNNAAVQEFIAQTVQAAVQEAVGRMAQGPIGPDGPMGPEGPRGPAGERGGYGYCNPSFAADLQQAANKAIQTAIEERKRRAEEAGRQGEGVVGPQVTGKQGPPGETGARGLRGETGARGIRGEKGDMGLRGLEGLAGPQGERGPAGERGPPGEKGPRGHAGKSRRSRSRSRSRRSASRRSRSRSWSPATSHAVSRALIDRRAKVLAAKIISRRGGRSSN